jgi:hypothetical protein
VIGLISSGVFKTIFRKIPFSKATAELTQTILVERYQTLQPQLLWTLSSSTHRLTIFRVLLVCKNQNLEQPSVLSSSQTTRQILLHRISESLQSEQNRDFPLTTRKEIDLMNKKLSRKEENIFRKPNRDRNTRVS